MTAKTSPSSFDALRRFAQRKPKKEQCELCGQALGPEHQHLVELAVRRLVCCCDACAILFSGQANVKYRRVPRRVEFLREFRMSDVQWEALHLPINLAFFYQSTPAERIVAMFPSPAGATESLLTFESWRELAAENPVLGELEPDVEALLVNRVGPLREYWRVPIDECFKLVGIIRIHWRGLSGGTQVWKEIAAFTESLRKRAGETSTVSSSSLVPPLTPALSPGYRGEGDSALHTFSPSHLNTSHQERSADA